MLSANIDSSFIIPIIETEFPNMNVNFFSYHENGFMLKKVDMVIDNKMKLSEYDKLTDVVLDFLYNSKSELHEISEIIHVLLKDRSFNKKYHCIGHVSNENFLTELVMNTCESFNITLRFHNSVEHRNLFYIVNCGESAINDGGVYLFINGFPDKRYQKMCQLTGCDEYLNHIFRYKIAVLGDDKMNIRKFRINGR